MAVRVCAEPTCPELVEGGNRCPAHRPKPWRNRGNRTTTTGLSGWQRQQRAQRVMRQHDGICHVCHQAGADQVDHIVPLAEGGPDTEHNLAPIHREPCHRTKTQAESARARRRDG
jgi:5-methylcytosine-specific restriction protein A